MSQITSRKSNASAAAKGRHLADSVLRSSFNALLPSVATLPTAQDTGCKVKLGNALKKGHEYLHNAT